MGYTPVMEVYVATTCHKSLMRMVIWKRRGSNATNLMSRISASRMTSHENTTKNYVKVCNMAGGEDAISKISSGRNKHERPQPNNPSSEPSGSNVLPDDIKRLLVMPLLVLQIGGFGGLIAILVVFIVGRVEVTSWMWVALIAALAGSPYGLAVNIKKVTDAVSSLFRSSGFSNSSSNPLT